MKATGLALSAIVVSVLMLAGCTKSSYAIYTQDGRTIVSQVKPTESDAGLVAYTDANGVKQQINKTEVKEIAEVK